MKRALIAIFAVFFIASVSIAAFFYNYHRSVQAKLAEFTATADRRKQIFLEIVIDVPPETPKDQTLYICGSASSMGSWEPSKGARAERQADGKYHTTVEVLSGIEYGFKITRGTWGSVEKGPTGEEIPNRVLNVEKPEKLEVKVSTWVDGGKAVPGRVVLSGQHRFHYKTPSKLLGNERTIIVYLPLDYDKHPEQRYPVLYMQDGQNLFDESTSYAGVEWGLDEAAQRLIDAGKIKPLIIVGIYNTEQREEEFTPPSLAATKPGKGDLYARFIVEEIKPLIDKTYRTMPDRTNTAIGGGSMGGLIALYTAQTHPLAFGQVALFSPWLQMNGKKLAASWSEDQSWLKGMKIYLEMGGKGGSNYPTNTEVADARELASIFDAAGLKRGNDYTFEELPDQEHTESAWASRVEPMLLTLYKK